MVSWPLSRLCIRSSYSRNFLARNRRVQCPRSHCLFVS